MDRSNAVNTRLFNEDTSRRSWMAAAARSLLGVSLVGGIGPRHWQALAQAAEMTPPTGKAKSVIFLSMTGAMSHLETLDPKPGTSSAGATTAIQSRVPGVLVSELMPKLSYMLNGISLIRSLTTETADHEQGKYLMRTSYKPLNSIRHPGLGAWANHIHERANKHLPGNVLLGSSAGHPGAGFLPASIAPVPVPNSANGLQNTKSPPYLADDQFKRRMSLASQFDASFRSKNDSQLIDAYDQTVREAVRLMGSAELKVFDINAEKEQIRNVYGQTQIGQSCLLARRLVEKGVRFIEVEYGNWDHHADINKSCPKMVTELDNALSALLRDLSSKGLLDEVLVVLSTEFGRSPSINVNAGRDHHPGVFSGLMCGAGVKAGVFGKSDALGGSVDEDGVSHQDVNATIATALGLPLDQEFEAPNGRPFRICDNGQPIQAILA